MLGEYISMTVGLVPYLSLSLISQTFALSIYTAEYVLNSGKPLTNNDMPSSTRWCPTPEQLMILEELYRRGLRTPTAPQIQRITAHLSLYGRIQGKNVFYWFQNHKARDRQKLRKRLASAATYHLLHPPPPQFQLCHFPSFQTLCGYYPPINLPHAPQVGQEALQAARPSSRTSSCDLEKEDWLMGDFSKIMEVGPRPFPCCTTQPPRTLQLFPLSSSTQNSTPSS